MTHADVRYLEAKRSVDDRALSPRVRDRMLAALPPEPRVLDAGCGTGSMLSRLHDWGVTAGAYRGVDRDPTVVSFAREDRPRAMRSAGASVDGAGRTFTVDDLSVTFESDDALEVFGAGGDSASGDADLFVAAAFADLVPIQSLVAVAESALRPGGLAYFPITFDGGTIFQPDRPEDDAVERAFHRTIDRRPGRDSRAGRRLADLLRRRGGDLVAMAASDWVVHPRGGDYPADERHFLSCILGFVEDALAGAPEESPDGTDEWLAARRRHLADGDLTYVAHQYDLLYRAPTPD